MSILVIQAWSLLSSLMYLPGIGTDSKTCLFYSLHLLATSTSNLQLEDAVIRDLSTGTSWPETVSFRTIAVDASHDKSLTISAMQY